MAYYTNESCYSTSHSSYTTGCKTEYADSEVRYAVDAWAAAKFTDELETVDGYSARLLKLEELGNLGYEWGPTCATCSNGWIKTASVPSWVYSNNYWYWTMSQYNDYSTNVWYVDEGGNVSTTYVNYNNGAVRPVINVYKDKLPE